MRILFLGHLPGRTLYDASTVTELLNSYASPGTTIDLGAPDDFGGSQLEVRSSEYSLLVDHLRTPMLIRKILWAQENGYDAVIQSNTYDPGVEAGRLAVSIPVIGLLRTAMHVATTLADRVGLAISSGRDSADLERQVWRLLRAYQVDRHVSGIRAMSGAYSAAASGNKAAIFDAALSAIKALVAETGAEIVLPLGGVIIPYRVDPMDLQRESGVQVLNSKAIGIRFAELCVNLGLTHSAITYPRVALSSEDLV